MFLSDSQANSRLFLYQALEKFSTDCPITDDDKVNEAIYDKKVITYSNVIWNIFILFEIPKIGPGSHGSILLFRSTLG
jgi:hypothetical protein